MTTIPDGKGEVVLTFNISGNAGPALIVHGFEWDFLTDPDDVAESIADDFAATFMPQSVNTVSLVGARVVINDGGTFREGLWSGSVAGSGAVDGASPQVAVLVRKLTGLAGREFRGRMYLPGPSENAVTASGFLAATNLAAYQTAADNYLAALLSNAHPMILLHDNPATAVNTVTSLSVDPKVATQRRRLR